MYITIYDNENLDKKRKNEQIWQKKKASSIMRVLENEYRRTSEEHYYCLIDLKLKP